MYDVSRADKGDIPVFTDFSESRPINWSNMAEDESERYEDARPVTAVNSDEEESAVLRIDIHDTYTKEEWEKLVAHRRGNGIGGI